LLDLTETNPTAVGLPYPAGLLAPLAHPRSLRYAPAPLGVPVARDAVARAYAPAGTPVAADRVVLTSSTSEAYSLLFKLLCGTGDDVVIPQPGYPLFESLTALDRVVARPYRLEYHGAWSIDRDSLLAAITPATRAVLVVSPNNPTGSWLRRDDRDWLDALCAKRRIVIIADEVFADYPLRPLADAVSCLGEARALTFVLGGLSRSAGLPQLKLAWAVACGPDAAVREALDRLEIICDTYLSVSTPVQEAAADLIAAGAAVRAAIQLRITGNLELVERLVATHPAVTLLAPEGGWSAVLRVPATDTEETQVLRLLRDAHVLVHPGYFFDFAHEAFLVVSLLPEPFALEAGLVRVLDMATRGGAA
jgi:aspartate/methionine/tyrosine aminotransferase